MSACSTEELFNHQMERDTLQTEQLDVCGGHAGRGDDDHYQVRPTCMIEQMVKRRGRRDHRVGLRWLSDLR